MQIKIEPAVYRMRTGKLGRTHEQVLLKIQLTTGGPNGETIFNSLTYVSTFSVFTYPRFQ